MMWSFLYCRVRSMQRKDSSEDKADVGTFVRQGEENWVKEKYASPLDRPVVLRNQAEERSGHWGSVTLKS